jgi:hypothetical protein
MDDKITGLSGDHLFEFDKKFESLCPDRICGRVPFSGIPVFMSIALFNRRCTFMNSRIGVIVTVAVSSVT